MKLHYNSDHQFGAFPHPLLHCIAFVVLGKIGHAEPLSLSSARYQQATTRVKTPCQWKPLSLLITPMLDLISRSRSQCSLTRLLLDSTYLYRTAIGTCTLHYGPLDADAPAYSPLSIHLSLGKPPGKAVPSDEIGSNTDLGTVPYKPNLIGRVIP